ncbi:MAG: DNA-3-methyladenine glycosylase [Patescibacteria group bacterium]
MRLKRKFFNRNTVLVAQELLGKFLVRRIGNKLVKAKITETEAYCGTRDLACHASKGLTERTKVMFGSAGFSYVYMVYGMYHCLNIVTEKEGNPAAVLIRSVGVVDGLPRSELPILSFAAQPQSEVLLRGPGILCRELKIDRKLNAVDLIKSNLLWIEDGEIKIKKSQIKKGKRIGVGYAGKWKDKLWRFYL